MASLRETMLKTDPGDKVFGMPQGFSDARSLIRSAIYECMRARMRNDAIAAALLTEALPALLALHGKDGCVRFLNGLVCAAKTDATLNADKRGFADPLPWPPKDHASSEQLRWIAGCPECEVNERDKHKQGTGPMWRCEPVTSEQGTD